MIVTFDSQIFRAVVEPHRHLRHPFPGALERVHAAILGGIIEPVASEGMFALEEIVRADRAKFLASRRTELKAKNERTVGHSVRWDVSIGPDHSLHPGLSLESQRRFRCAGNLGFQYMNIPRFGMVRPPELQQSGIYFNLGRDFHEFVDYAERFDKVSAELEKRGVGFAIAHKIGLRARRRAAGKLTWCELLTDPRFFNDNERLEIGAAVSEWCDGDLVAASVAHGIELICTEDHAGRKQRHSVFNNENRAWLAGKYRLRFLSLNELASLIPK